MPGRSKSLRNQQLSRSKSDKLSETSSCDQLPETSHIDELPGNQVTKKTRKNSDSLSRISNSNQVSERSNNTQVSAVDYNQVLSTSNTDQRHGTSSSDPQPGSSKSDPQPGTSNNDPQPGTSNNDSQPGTSDSGPYPGTSNSDTQPGSSVSEQQNGISNSGEVGQTKNSEQTKKISSSKILKSLNNTKLGFVEDEDGVIRLEDLVIPAAPAPVLTNDVPDSRLVITHLTVRNFKSYAGEQVIGPFNKNFTAVVGPNGSGKSNVIDALMFVFGTKARNIRAKKISALIHRSSQHPDIASCSVAVNFAIIKDEDGGKIVEDSRFIVSRTVNHDSSSYYEICNKRVQQKEVIRTLRAYGIDMEYNRFLIMQGEIESISLMNPKGLHEHETGMLEYIEDIIGSNRLIEPIKYLNTKVEELERDIKEKDHQLQLVAKERTELEGPMKKAIEFLRLENKLILSENCLFQLQRMKIEEELKEILESKEKFMEEMKSLKAEMEKTQAARKSLGNELSRLNSEHDAFLKKCEECKEEFKALEREDASNLMDIKHAKLKAQNIEKSLEEGKKELIKLEKQAAVFESETKELHLKKKKLEEEKDVDEKKATEVIGSLKQETTLMQEKKDKLESELIKLKDNMNQIKSEMDLTQSELKLYMSEEKKEKEKLTTLISDHEKNSENSKREEIILQEEMDKVPKIERELVSLKEQLSEAKEKELSLTQQWKNERMKLEDAKSSQQTSQNSSSLLQGLLKEKASGRLPGIYGRLGDLGAIDEKYDVAISTACGRLDNIVTDTLSTAQACVEFLKKHNLGYATFIALDQMKKWESYVHQKISTPENVPRLFDLVRVKDQSLLTAFYFGLGNTLVAKDLEQATRIGLQGRERHRVVTLKGEVIDLAGTMSGGGGRVSKGRMGQTVVENNLSKEDFARMSAEVDALGRKGTEMKRLCINLEDQIAQKGVELSSLQHSLRKRKLHCKANKERTEMLASQIVEQKKKVANLTVDQKKIRSLEEEIKSKNKCYSVAVKETSTVEQSVTELQDEILKVSKGKFNKAKKTIDQIKKKFDEVTQAITKSTVNMKQCNTKMKKLGTKLENMQKDFEANKKILQGLREKQELLTVKGTKATELIAENQVELSKYKEKVVVVKKEIEAISEKEHQLKRTEIEFKNTLKKFESNESEKRAIRKSINSKIGKLKMNEVEEDSTELPSLSKDEISRLNLKNLTSEIDIVKVQLEDMKPDLSAINEYHKKEKIHQEKKKEVEKVKSEKALQSMRYHELRKRRLCEFMSGFAVIANKLKEIYQMLTLGGDAELELVDGSDPFLKGIEFSVRPPKKSWKFMRNLSGGEKTLSSLSLVFALHYYRPTPFYVMDEIDAALDVRNVAIVGYFLKERTKNAQFIIVSLRNVMNELSDHLLGIYKINNCTQNVSISNVSKWK